MTNAHAIKLLSRRTRSLLRLHAEAIGVDEAKLASDLFDMMVRDGKTCIESGGQTSARDVATELDRKIAAALKATAGSLGPLGGTVNRLNSIHKTFKAQLASGQLTDAQFVQKARELLNILGNFDGLIADIASTGVIGGQE